MRFLALYQILVEQADIGHYSDGHPVVDSRLEFKQNIDIQPVGTPPNSPDDIIFPFPQIVTDIIAIHLFQAGEIKSVDPVFLDKALQQVFHHPGMGKKVFITVIVIGHGTL